MKFSAARLKLGELTLFNFHSLNSSQAGMVLRWRNSPGVRRWMYSAGSITRAEHACFRRRLRSDRQNCYWLVKGPGGRWTGVVYLNRIGRPAGAAWLGIYANPGSTASGKGVVLMEALKRLAFERLKLGRLNLEVFTSNQKAEAFYRRQGFRAVRLVRRKRGDGSLVEVRVMTLQKGDWNGI